VKIIVRDIGREGLIAFTRIRRNIGGGGTKYLIIVKPDGSEMNVLYSISWGTRDPEPPDPSPSATQDGKWIAYPTTSGIVVAHPDGSEAQTIPNTIPIAPLAIGLNPPVYIINPHPAIYQDADGNMKVIYFHRTARDPSDSGHGDLDNLISINIDGTQKTNITRNDGSFTCGYPVVSSLDSVPAYVSDSGICLYASRSPLLNGDGGNDPGFDSSGRLIAFSKSGNIYSCDLHGGSLRHVTKTGGYAHPAFSPKGKHFAVVKGFEPSAIYQIMYDGGQEFQITHPDAGESDSEPCWINTGN